MLLVADGGSSKTDWILLNNDKSIEKHHTSGLNPFFLSEKDITRNLNQYKHFNLIADGIKEVHFFGAGCSSPDRREIVSNALRRILNVIQGKRGIHWSSIAFHI